MSEDRHTLRTTLVLGGARSGKSTFAERLANESGGPVLYVATATAEDEEMTQRIATHQARRHAAWRTLEEPLNVAERVAAEVPSRPTATILVEDLTLLLANLMAEDATADAADIGSAEWRMGAVHAETRALAELTGLLALPTNVILVSNEVGMGIVPPYPSGRAFRDALGRLNQAAARQCDEVYLLVAGLPLRLK